MYKEQVYVTTNVALVLDGMVIILAGYAAYYLRWLLGDSAEWGMEGGMFISIVMSLMFVNCYVLGQLGFYASDFNPPFRVALRKVVLAVAIDFSLVTLGMFFIKEDTLSRLFLGIYAGLVFVGLMVVRALFYHFFRHSANAYGMRRILLIGSSDRVRSVFDAFQRQKSWGHTLVGSLAAGSLFEIEGLPCLGTAEDLPRIIAEKDIDEVVFTVPGNVPFDFPAYLDVCKEMGLTCRIVPAMFAPDDGRWGLQVDSIDNIPALSIYGTTINASGLFYKRLLDLIGGAVGFALFCLMYLPIALAIKLESPGPVLFSQVRVGQNNRKFLLYKFRSMYADAEEHKQELMGQNEMEGHMFKMKDDPRVTRVGRFLRKTSLDEFPQFINVIRGEMSLVGTRPPTVDEVSHYTKAERRRISMKPGVTGLWQVSGRNEINDFADVVRLDLEYIDGWRFFHDIEIVFKTIWVIFTKHGAS
ncbi:MAG: sugar transferase [Desulfovibrionaceae bacterium]|nr:sugar transferase [Desulfovibrionaceae bacterium]